MGDGVICASCGTENAAGRRFCDECGSPLAVICATCGQPNRGDAKFCGDCGSPLGRGAGAPAGPAPSAAGGGGMPSVTAAPAATPVAERRFVSVLFADLVGFTSYSEGRDPEAVREMLSRYFEIARAAIERHGGTVEKFIGDAVMAAWGTPVAHEDDAERAVRAAIALLDAVAELGDGLQARAGVLTGEAAVTVGATHEGMVAGDIVNTAARLQSVAQPGTVLVGEATMHAAGGAIAFEPVGEHELKGKASPVPAWRTLQIVAERGGRRRAEGLEGPFVGRERELRLLKDLVHGAAEDRRPQVVSITGAAGVGKSRLAWELEKYVDGLVEDVYWHRGRSPSYGEGVSFWALGEMVRARAGLAEGDDEPTTRRRVGETVSDFVPDEEDRRWVEPALLALLGLEAASAGGRDVLFAAWRIFFERVAARGTTVLLFEDLHWADGGLLDFIDHLLEWTRDLPILVITLARPELFERRPGWGTATRHFTGIALEPLPEAAMRELVAGLVPEMPEPTMAAILARAEGMPLYAIETIRVLVAEGRLERVDGHLRPRGALGDLEVPETLRSLIAARLDALESLDRELVLDAAVLGQSFSIGSLASIRGLPEADVESRLRGLARRELVRLEVDPRSPERGHYAFVQGLIREVAYGTLARRERRARHLAVARHFEAEGDEETAGVLASHYLAAYRASADGPESDAVAVQARLAFRAAAERAADLGSHEQALAHLDDALSITTDGLERAHLQERASVSADAIGRYSDAMARAQEAIDGHRAAGDAVATARASAHLAVGHIDAGELPDAVEVIEGALAELPPGVGDPERADLLSNLARALMRMEVVDRALETADQALAIAEPLNLERVIAEAFVNRGSALSLAGRRREAAAIMAASLRIAEAGEWPTVAMRAYNNLATVEVGDDLARSASTVRLGIDLGRRVGDRGMLLWMLGTNGWLAYVRGRDWDEALDWIDDALGWPMEVYDRFTLRAAAAAIRLARGEPVDDVLAEGRAAKEIVEDPRLFFLLEVLVAESRLIEADFEAAHAAYVRANEAQRFELMAYDGAVRSGLWLGDPERIRAAEDALRAASTGGRIDRAYRAAARSAALVVEGRAADATGAYLEAIDLHHQGGADFVAARTTIDALAAIGPAEPALAAAADAAEETFRQVGATPYLAWLEAVRAGRSRPAGPDRRRPRSGGMRSPSEEASPA